MNMSRTSMYVTALVIYLSITMVTDTAASQDKHPKKYKETVVTADGRKISFEMVQIPGGSFLMGSSASEVGRQDNEGPQHKVRLDSFYLCTTETTLELFMAYYEETVTSKEDYIAIEQAKKNSEQPGEDDIDAITGPTPVYGDITLGYGQKNPAMGMTWNNAMTFLRWLSRRTGKKYRLPTEAEWEYAYRAGTTSIFSFGNDPNGLADFSWFEADADHETHEVAQKKPNAWGLYDMSGNVREWVYDFYSSTAYKEAAERTPAVNPKGPKTGKIHVARGGDYNSSVEELRCAYRAFEEKWWRSGDPQFPKSKWWLPEMDIIGFRVARSLEKDTKKSNK